MKQLSSAFVVVEETRDVTVCEYVTRNMMSIHRFAIVWDDDHDTRVVGAIHVLMVTGEMDHIDVVGERKGDLTMWTEYPHTAPDEIMVNGDLWSTDPTDNPDCLHHDVRRVFSCGLRPFHVFGGGQ
jgi:hypothetical protein